MFPTAKILRNRGINLTNPMPADALFINGVQNYLKNEKMPYDCYIACYHDQGLIPFKMLAFDRGVNLSFGMKYIRTSVDHGTGVDLIGTLQGSNESLKAAYNLAIKLTK